MHAGRVSAPTTGRIVKILRLIVVFPFEFTLCRTGFAVSLAVRPILMTNLSPSIVANTTGPSVMPKRRGANRRRWPRPHPLNKLSVGVWRGLITP